MEKKKKFDGGKACHICVMFIMVILTMCACGQAAFNDDEKYALECVNKLKDMAKYPSSFELTDDIIVYNYVPDDTEKNLSGKVCIVTYSAENSYAMAYEDNAVFFEGDYYGTTDEINEEYADIQKEDYSTDNEYGDAIKEALFWLNMLNQYYEIDLQRSASDGKVNSEDIDGVIIDVKDISKELNIKNSN